MKKSIYFLLAVVSLLFCNCNKDEIDDLKERVDKIESILVTDLQKELTQTKDSISAINKKINTLARELSSVADLADDLEQLRSDLAAAQQNFVTICEDAIASAMAENNSVISGEIAASLNNARTEWQEAIRLVDEKVSNLTSGVGSVQGLTYIPTHVDGKATMSFNIEGSKATLDFFVAPKSIVKELKAEHISAQAVYTASTRGVNLVELPVTQFESDTVNGTITVEVSGENLSEEFFNGEATASMFLRIAYGSSECVSESIEFELVKLADPVKLLGDITNPADVVTGDYAMVDGSFISGSATLTDEQKAGVAGIVYWTTKDTDPTGRQTPASLTDDKVLAADFPNCNHGLIVSLKNVSTSLAWQSTVRCPYADFQNTDNFTETNKADYIVCHSKATGETAPINYIYGYQYTKLFKLFNNFTASNRRVQVVHALGGFSESNPAPKNSTGWFIPSVKELHMLRYKDVDNVYDECDPYDYSMTKDDTRNAMNTKLEALGTTYADKLSNSEYWSSSEYENITQYNRAWTVNFFDGQVTGNIKKTSMKAVRAVCAF